jgi:hypothetical protein
MHLASFEFVPFLSSAPSIAALHLQGGTSIAVRSNLRLAGGSDTDAADALKEARLKSAGASGLGQERAEAGAENDEKNDWKAAAKRRAEQARSAGSHPREAIGKTIYRIFTSATNKLGLTVCECEDACEREREDRDRDREERQRQRESCLCLVLSVSVAYVGLCSHQCLNKCGQLSSSVSRVVAIVDVLF